MISQVYPQIQLAIIQATPFCNIDCDYCYLPGRSITRRMKWDTLTKIAQRVLESPFAGAELTVVWHAGEPLVVPLDFYQQAYEIFQEMNHDSRRIVFSFQTNGTLINERWCEFFVRCGAHVGISLDGPKRFHDRHRVDRSGRGTFDRAIRGLRLLQASGIHPPVIMVLTREALDFPAEIWEFLVANNIDFVGFNPEEAEGTNISSSVHNDESEAAYRRFLERFLRLSADAGGIPRIREAESALGVLRSADAVASAHDNVPMAIVSFDCDGNISTFSPELLTANHAPFGTFTFGNVHEQSLADVLHDRKFTQVNTAIQAGVAECRATCDYYRFCGGGSPSNKIVERGTFAATETRSCRLRIKVAVSAMVDHLHGLPQGGQARGGSA
jgi:uncharacterized protein